MAKPIKKQKTTIVNAKKAQEKRQWFTFDADGKTLGRFSTLIVNVLRGKHRVDFTPHMDCGDGVIVINADKIRVTGAKEAQKEYHRHSGRPGGLKTIPYRRMMDTKPDYILWHAIKGMMPKGKLGRNQLKRLRLFVGTSHDMQAQQPTLVEL